MICHPRKTAIVKKSLIFLLLATPSTNLIAGTILIDLGSPNGTGTTPTTYETPGNWNNITNSTSGSATDLIDSDGNTTPFDIAVTSGFGSTNNVHNGGSPSLTPSTASIDAFFSNSSTGSTLTLSQLDPTLTYSFRFFASVFRGDSISRNARYTVGGSSVELDPYNNSSTWSAPISGISPDVNGNIVIDVRQGLGNNGGNYLLGIVEITTVPEPASAFLGALGLIPLLRRRR